MFVTIHCQKKGNWLLNSLGMHESVSLPDSANKGRRDLLRGIICILLRNSLFLSDLDGIVYSIPTTDLQNRGVGDDSENRIHASSPIDLLEHLQV